MGVRIKDTKTGEKKEIPVEPVIPELEGGLQKDFECKQNMTSNAKTRFALQRRHIKDVD